MDYKKRIEESFEEMVSIRRLLHMNPELSNEEYNTQQFILDFLNEHDINCQPIAKTGVIGYIGNQGPCVALRADIDALPIQETNDVMYKSKKAGVMHACGHDVHTTILLGTAQLLKEMEQELNVRVKLLFQPAEETTGGALPMIDEGALDDTDYVFGLHVMPYLETGTVEIKHGQLNAASNAITIKVKGQSGHGAYPDKGVDSIIVSSYLLTALQTIVSRNVSPLDAAVLSFGSIHGGDKANIICDEVILKGTLRTLTPESRTFCLKRIKEIVQNTTVAFGADYELNIEDGYEALINDNQLVDYIKDTLEDELNIVYKDQPSLGVEDFAYFSNRVKGAFYHLGCSNNHSTSLHQGDFDVDESCIKAGILSQLKLIANINL